MIAYSYSIGLSAGEEGIVVFNTVSKSNMAVKLKTIKRSIS
jgi:hypothetical protein